MCVLKVDCTSLPLLCQVMLDGKSFVLSDPEAVEGSALCLLASIKFCFVFLTSEAAGSSLEGSALCLWPALIYVLFSDL